MIEIQLLRHGEWIEENSPPVVSSGVSVIVGSSPSSVGLGIDGRRLHVATSASGSNRVKVWTFEISSVAVRYPSTQSNVYAVGCVDASMGTSHTGRQRRRTNSTVTSIRRRIVPWSQRLLHQTTTPNPTVVMGGNHVRKTLSGGSKDGANSATKASILNNVVGHGTAIVNVSIRRSMFKDGRQGDKGGHELESPSKVAQEVLKASRKQQGSPDRVPPFRRPLPFHFRPNRVVWPNSGTKQVNDGKRALAHKREDALCGKLSWLQGQ